SAACTATNVNSATSGTSSRLNIASSPLLVAAVYSTTYRKQYRELRGICDLVCKKQASRRGWADCLEGIGRAESPWCFAPGKNRPAFPAGRISRPVGAPGRRATPSRRAAPGPAGKQPDRQGQFVPRRCRTLSAVSAVIVRNDPT